eukprot:Clim_evm27s146 gene=Clim_evmTU27s146
MAIGAHSASYAFYEEADGVYNYDDVESCDIPKKYLFEEMGKRNRGRASEASKKENQQTEPIVESVNDDELIRVFRIVAGSYERTIFGYDFFCDEATFEAAQELDGKNLLSVGTLRKKTSFVMPVHGGMVTAIACQGSHLASGSSDETINVFNMKKNVEEGALMEHTGTITALSFHGTRGNKAYLVSGSEDHTVLVFRTTDWEVLARLKGHKGAIEDLAVHPTGKLMISAGRDRTLRVWDMIKARGVFIRNLPYVVTQVRWSPEGHSFAIVHGNTIEIYDLEDAESGDATHTIVTGFRNVLSIAYVGENLIAVAGDSSDLHLYEIKPGETPSKKRKITIKGDRDERGKASCPVGIIPDLHGNRIKCVKCLDDPVHAESKIIITASSDGHIKVVHVASKAGSLDYDNYTELAHCDSKARLQCLAVSETGEF